LLHQGKTLLEQKCRDKLDEELRSIPPASPDQLDGKQRQAHDLVVNGIQQGQQKLMILLDTAGTGKSHTV
jgi:hypothetical protein